MRHAFRNLQQRSAGILCSLWLLTACGVSVDPAFDLQRWEELHLEFLQNYDSQNFKEAERFAKLESAQARKLQNDDLRPAVSFEDAAELKLACGKMPEALELSARALRLIEESASTKSIADTILLRDLKVRVLSKMALVLCARGNLDKAAQSYLQIEQLLGSRCLNLREQFIDKPADHQLVQCLCSHADISVQLKHYKQAQELFTAALDLADLSYYPEFLLRQERDKFVALLKAAGQMNDANSVEKEGDLVQCSRKGVLALDTAPKFALKELEQARVEALKNPQRTKLIAQSYANLVVCQFLCKNYSLARDLAQQGVKIGERNKDLYQDRLIALWATMQMQAGAYARAIESYAELVNSRQSLYGYNSLEAADAFARLSLAYSKEGDKGKALDAVKRARQILFDGNEHSAEATAIAKLIGSVCNK